MGRKNPCLLKEPVKGYWRLLNYNKEIVSPNVGVRNSVHTSHSYRSTEGADRCLNVMGLPRDSVESLVTRLQNLTTKEFKRILESEAHPCKRFLEKPVDHGHNLRSCKTNPAHLRIPVSRTVRHKQSFIPRGAKLNLI